MTTEKGEYFLVGGVNGESGIAFKPFGVGNIIFENTEGVWTRPINNKKIVWKENDIISDLVKIEAQQALDKIIKCYNTNEQK